MNCTGMSQRDGRSEWVCILPGNLVKWIRTAHVVKVEETGATGRETDSVWCGIQLGNTNRSHYDSQISLQVQNT